jgi:hypothetical protein
MIYKIKEYKNKLIEKAFKDGMREFNKFFDFSLSKKIGICILNNRKEIDLFFQEKTKPWVVSFVKPGGNIIYILDNNKFNKESSHKKESNEKYSGLIKHELCHFFDLQLSKDCYKPLWLGEGLAVYLSGQFKYEQPISYFSDFIKSYDEYADYHAFTDGGFAVKLLVENFGKQKLLKLISKSGEAKNKKDFAKLFKKIYGFDLNYKNFNSLLKKK